MYDSCVFNDRTSIKVDRRSDINGKWRMLHYVYPQPGRILCGFGKKHSYISTQYNNPLTKAACYSLVWFCAGLGSTYCVDGEEFAF